MGLELATATGELILSKEKQVYQWTDGSLLTKHDVFRMSFAGATMLSSVCTNYSCSTLPFMRVQSGSLNDFTYDVTYSLCLAGNYGVWRVAGVGSATGPLIRFGGNISCLGGTSTFDPTVYVAHSGPNIGKIIVEVGILASSVFHSLFDGVIDPCDLEDGMVVDNTLTTTGCTTRSLTGGACSVYAYGGTCTISRICPP
jgi:hypothetical protein